jgi:hypothetical protein
MASQSLRISRAASPVGSISVTPLPVAAAFKNRRLTPIWGAYGFERGDAVSHVPGAALRRTLIEEKCKSFIHEAHSAASHLGYPNVECGWPCWNDCEVSGLHSGKRRGRFQHWGVNNNQRHFPLRRGGQRRRKARKCQRAHRQLAVHAFGAPSNGAAFGIQVENNDAFARFLGRGSKAGGKRSFAASAIVRCEYYGAH